MLCEGGLKACHRVMLSNPWSASLVPCLTPSPTWVKNAICTPAADHMHGATAAMRRQTLARPRPPSCSAQILPRHSQPACLSMPAVCSHAASRCGNPEPYMRCREAVRSSNAAVVLQTLVPQARAIFQLLAQAQLSEQAEEDGSEGPATFRAMQHTHGLGPMLASVVWEQDHPSIALPGSSSIRAFEHRVCQHLCLVTGVSVVAQHGRASRALPLLLAAWSGNDWQQMRLGTASPCLMVLLLKQGRLGSHCDRQLDLIVLSGGSLCRNDVWAAVSDE